MLKKDQRLNLSESFKDVVSNSKRVETAHFKLFVQKNDKNTFPKIGIALTKKEFRKAHERNKARRITSQLIEMHYIRLIPQINLVIMPKATVTQAEIKELSDEIGAINYLYSAH